MPIIDHQHYLFASNLWIWMGSITLWTDAIVSWRRVLADSMGAAGMIKRFALVDVTAVARHSCVSCVFWSACAHEAAEGVGTQSVFAAHCFAILTFIHVWCNKQRNL